MEGRAEEVRLNYEKWPGSRQNGLERGVSEPSLRPPALLSDSPILSFQKSIEDEEEQEEEDRRTLISGSRDALLVHCDCFPHGRVTPKKT